MRVELCDYARAEFRTFRIIGQIPHNPTSSALSVLFMNDVLLYIRNFAYSHDSANVSAADRAKLHKKSKVFEDGGKLYCRSHRHRIGRSCIWLCVIQNLKRFLAKNGKNKWQKVRT